jgi:hypothetical protein
MKPITLFNAYKKVKSIMRQLDIDYTRLYIGETDKIEQWGETRKRYERLEQKLNYRLSYFLEYGKMPRPTHCVICGWWESACRCDKFRAPKDRK